MNHDNLEETNSGVKKKGRINDVAEFSDEVEKVMEEAGAEKQSIKDFKDWKPEKDDSEDKVKEKTVKKASMPKKEIEEETEGVKKDLEQAAKNAGNATKKIKQRKKPNKELKEASKDAAKPVISKSIKMARKTEETIYSKFMLKFNSYYFDTKEFSANLTRKDEENYEMAVDAPDKKYREALKQKFHRN